jgi:hypothetical protein
VECLKLAPWAAQGFLFREGQIFFQDVWGRMENLLTFKPPKTTSIDRPTVLKRKEYNYINI